MLPNFLRHAVALRPVAGRRTSLRTAFSLFTPMVVAALAVASAPTRSAAASPLSNVQVVVSGPPTANSSGGRREGIRRQDAGKPRAVAAACPLKPSPLLPQGFAVSPPHSSATTAASVHPCPLAYPLWASR